MNGLGLQKNEAGGIDLLVERDRGNQIRVLTGIKSKEFFTELRDLCETALNELEFMEDDDGM